MTDRVATATSYIGAGTAVVGGLNFNEWLALGGLIVAILGFIYNVWYKERLLKVARQKSEISFKD